MSKVHRKPKSPPNTKDIVRNDHTLLVSALGLVNNMRAEMPRLTAAQRNTVPPCVSAVFLHDLIVCIDALTRHAGSINLDVRASCARSINCKKNKIETKMKVILGSAPVTHLLVDQTPQTNRTYRRPPERAPARSRAPSGT